MPTVLIVDDSIALRERVQSTLLKEGLADRVLLAKDGADGLKLLANEPVDLILLDLVMPGLDGFKFLNLKLQRQAQVPVPVIVLTGTDKVEDKIRGFAAGASDYLTKPFHDDELVARVRVHLQLKLKTETLQQLARTDPLTGLANRGYFMECLKRELHRSSRSGSPLGLLMVDLDHFKDLNDLHGHQAGDAFLQKIAEVLPRGLRSSDLVGRYGGEEFIVLLPDADAKGVMIVAERSRDQVSKIALPFSSKLLKATGSFGAVSTSKAGVSVKNIIRAADVALYKAKEAGRNHVCLSSELDGGSSAVATRPAPKLSPDESS